MDVAAGAGGHGAQEITNNDGIGVGAADAPGGFRGDAAGAVGAETAADALKSESAFGALALYAVMGSLHREAGDKLLQGFVCAFAGGAAVALVHFV